MADKCLQCGTAIIQPKRGGHRKYCSRHCSLYARSIAYHKANPRKYKSISSISCGTVGAISELRVIVDLLSRNFDVFRAVSPTSSCDLMVFKDGEGLRIEVTTGHYSTTNKILYPTHSPDRYDTIAVVIGDEIHYLPDLNP